MIIDPYLVLESVCEVWNGDAELNIKQLRYFGGIGIYNELLFKMEKNKKCSSLKTFEHYRVIGTEWDVAPDWACCSTIDADGCIKFWKNLDPITDINIWKMIDKMVIPGYTCTNIICSDKSRYENNAWTKSLRIRPIWAGGN